MFKVGDEFIVVNDMSGTPKEFTGTIRVVKTATNDVIEDRDGWYYRFSSVVKNSKLARALR